MPEIALKVLDQTIEYCCAKYCTDKQFPSDIENLILSRLYFYAVQGSENYSWHVFVSEVHEPNQARIKEIHTNHDLLLKDAANVKEGQVTHLNQPDVHLKYYTKRVCNFKVQNNEKRLLVVIFNQSYKPSSSLETIYKGGAQGLIPEWDTVFSMRGLSFLAFMALLALLFINNTVCKDVLRELEMERKTGLTTQEVPEGVHPYEYESGEDREETHATVEEIVTREKTWKESFCMQQQNSLAQMAIAVLLLTAVRWIMTKGQERGRKFNQ